MAYLPRSPDLFPHDHLLARNFDLPSAKNRPQMAKESVKDAEVTSLTTSLWKESNFSLPEKKENPSDFVRRFNEKARSLTQACGGPTKTPFSLFHNNLRPTMCYVEDIYHEQCGHWAAKPRIYHRCANAPEERNQRCFNRNTVGSANEDSTCATCLANHEVLLAKAEEEKHKWKYAIKNTHRSAKKLGTAHFRSIRTIMGFGCRFKAIRFPHKANKGEGKQCKEENKGDNE